MKRGKSKTVGYILALFFGGLGAHLFYYGKYLRGILYLAFSWTGIPILLGWIDMFFIHKWHQQYLESQEISSESLQENPLQSITSRVEKTEPKKVESEKSVLLQTGYRNIFPLVLV
ncbi:TM2 domain-containing protein [Thermoanaerobacter wiegelii]|uniref:TM2 domain containing protein n=1 Tax=Thermoanaerobacter wiegelii Rt8.B1 TaxID=697303 RepID=G2MV65_9THEO|nr:TM2 domain-containing protein [Thermoanaerobacter wiegelii]AEM78244.1 TM2 domain containing protein [Thermoanaerobacter wiegelii Rt8.B1]